MNGSNRGSHQSSHSDLNESKGNVCDIVKLRIVIEISLIENVNLKTSI